MFPFTRSMEPSIERQHLYPKLPPVVLPKCGEMVNECHVLHVKDDVAYVTWRDLLPSDTFQCPVLHEMRGASMNSYSPVVLEVGNLCLLFENANNMDYSRSALMMIIMFILISRLKLFIIFDIMNITTKVR